MDARRLLRSWQPDDVVPAPAMTPMAALPQPASPSVAQTPQGVSAHAAPRVPATCPESAIERFHIAITQPAGYVHSLGFIDQARYLRHQLRRLGMSVTIGKNRLREDAINIVLGAHLGFDPALKVRHACIFVNLEQLGQGGAALSPQYLELLGNSAVADYDAGNLSAYGAAAQAVPLLPFRHAPYLHEAAAIPLKDRPIDLLFYGSMNERRSAFLSRIEACGWQIAQFDQPVYGPERDLFIRQAKAVLNCHFYESSRFEQVRVSHCLSLGTPVISERLDATRPPVDFEDAVSWIAPDAVEAFFTQDFASPRWYAQAQAQLAAFARCDPIDAFAELVGFARGYALGHARTRPAGPWKPTGLRVGAGAAYRAGWLNVDTVPAGEPDLILDLRAPVPLPLRAETKLGALVELAPSSLEAVDLGAWPDPVEGLPAALDQALAMLAEGGRCDLELPAAHAARTPWRDWSAEFWRMGWFEHRFEPEQGRWLDGQGRPCEAAEAASLRLSMRKCATTLNERTTARMQRQDFGGLAEDLVEAPSVDSDIATL